MGKWTFKAYYSQIAEVIWEFIEHRYNVPTFEKTSNEISESLKWVSINEKHFKEIEIFFQPLMALNLLRLIHSKKIMSCFGNGYSFYSK